jgi:hypothetical protein
MGYKEEYEQLEAEENLKLARLEGKVIRSAILSHGEVTLRLSDGTVVNAGDHYDEGGFYFDIIEVS